MLVLQGATVIPCQDDRTIVDGAIHIDGERIAWVGPAAEAPPVPPDATTQDLRGKTIIPGLCNAHIHFTMRRWFGPVARGVSIADDAFRGVRACLTALKEGVTLGRDLGHNDHVHRELQQAVEDGRLLGPRIYSAGEALGMPFGHAQSVCKIVKDKQEAVNAVREQITTGADFIKVITSHEEVWQFQGDELTVAWFDADILKAIAETAHSAKTPVTAHANGNEAIRRAIDAGFDCIEHGIYLNEENARLMKEAGMWLVPTMTGYKQNSDTFWQRGERWAIRYGHLSKAHFPSVRNALEAGIPLATGTDTLGTVAEEVELFIQCGMRPIDVLKAATINGAKLCKMDRVTGSIAIGKYADLVILGGNPLEDPSVLRAPEATYKGGVCYTADMLNLVIPASRHYAPGS